MHKSIVKKGLTQKLAKLYKKNRAAYNAVKAKMNDIASSSDIEHYKNLRKPLQKFKRVHVLKSFVLIFKYDKKKGEIAFYDLEHHDKVYLL